jgi:hypothetical protein
MLYAIRVPVLLVDILLVPTKLIAAPRVQKFRNSMLSYMQLDYEKKSQENEKMIGNSDFDYGAMNRLAIFEAATEALPQLIVQLINAYLLGSLPKDPFSIFKSISSFYSAASGMYNGIYYVILEKKSFEDIPPGIVLKIVRFIMLKFNRDDPFPEQFRPLPSSLSFKESCKLKLQSLFKCCFSKSSSSSATTRSTEAGSDIE